MSLHKIITVLTFCWCLLLSVWILVNQDIATRPASVTKTDTIYVIIKDDPIRYLSINRIDSCNNDSCMDQISKKN